MSWEAEDQENINILESSNSPSLNTQSSPTSQSSPIHHSLLVHNPASNQRYFKYKALFYFALFITCIITTAFIISIINQNTNDNDETKPFLTILQINDVYELNPVSGLGGMSRVSSIYKQLLQSEQNVVMALAGDFFSPSALGVANVAIDGQPATPLHGRQMVDVLNTIGVPKDHFLATFGNHEFDLSSDEFFSRIKESNFTYISTNVLPTHNYTFPSHVLPFQCHIFNNKKICFISLTISDDLGDIGYVSILTLPAAIQTLKQYITQWKSQNNTWDVLVGLTHHTIDDDAQLAEEFPYLDLIMGGHEHENWQYNRGTKDHPLFITKADSNAKSVFVHRFFWHNTAIPLNISQINPDYQYGTAFNIPGTLHIERELVVMDSSIPSDPIVQKKCDLWINKAFEAFAQSGLDPSVPMCRLTEAYNAQDKFTRNHVSPIGAFLADANLAAAQKLGLETKYGHIVSILNIGSVRVDDLLPIGPLIQYDALRILPFGGYPVLISVTGHVLQSVLAKAIGLLQSGMWVGFNPQKLRCQNQDPTNPSSIPTATCTWLINDVMLQQNTNYTVIIPNYAVRQGWASWFDSQDQWKELELPAFTLQDALITYFGEVYPFN